MLVLPVCQRLPMMANHYLVLLGKLCSEAYISGLKEAPHQFLVSEPLPSRQFHFHNQSDETCGILFCPTVKVIKYNQIYLVNFFL